MAMLVRILVAAAAVVMAHAEASSDCNTFMDCISCASNKTWTGENCRWCPKDSQCHAEGSLFNSCHAYEDITDSSKCNPVPPPPYIEHWCDGLDNPTLASGVNVSVIYVQAPLFSVNPSIGDKAKYADLYHTALVFKQAGPSGGAARYWTLEFDAAANLPGSIVPAIVDKNLYWRNQARWCFREGIYNGRAHWTTHFDEVAEITPGQLQDILHTFIPPLNSSKLTAFPIYNLWHVRSQDDASVDFVRDITCGNGVMWTIRYISDTLHVPVKQLAFKQTRVHVDAESVRAVDVSDSTEWAAVVDYYTWMVAELSSKTSTWLHIFEFFEMNAIKYVYDGNNDIYYEVIGNWLLGAYFEVDIEPQNDPPEPTTMKMIKAPPSAKILI